MKPLAPWLQSQLLSLLQRPGHAFLLQGPQPQTIGAGIQHRNTINDWQASDWDRVANANLKSCFFLAQACVRPMKAQGFGRLIRVPVNALEQYLSNKLQPGLQANK